MLEATSSYPPPGDAPAADTSFFAPPRRHRKVAILGFGGTARDCPWQDPSWELWAMNGFWRAAEADHGVKAPEDRYTLWFDMHTIEFTREYGKVAGIEGKQEAWLQEPHPFPIFMLDDPPTLEGAPQPIFPSVQRFPIEDLIAKVGRDYFTSTVAYALAFALAAPDIAEVGLWGIDLVHSTEYADQRPCAEYWIGRLDAAGIKVTIHEQSALLKQRGRYGYEISDPVVADLRGYLVGQIDRAQKALAANRAEMERLKDQMHTDDGAAQGFASVLERLDVFNRGGRI